MLILFLIKQVFVIILSNYIYKIMVVITILILFLTNCDSYNYIEIILTNRRNYNYSEIILTNCKSYDYIEIIFNKL